MTKWLTFEQLISVLSGIATIIALLLQVRAEVSFRTRKFLFLVTLVFAGVSVGALLPVYPIWVAIAAIPGLLLLIILSRSAGVEKLLAGYTKTMINAESLQNIVCDSIHETICSLVHDGGFDGDDLRVALFHVDWTKRILVMIARSPVDSWRDQHDVTMAVGQGSAGMCVESRRREVVENLPDWETQPEPYIQRLAAQYRLSEAEVRAFKRKSRSYYNFPVSVRDRHTQALRVEYVFCVDSTKPTIGSQRCTSAIWCEVIESLLKNSKDLLTIHQWGNH